MRAASTRPTGGSSRPPGIRIHIPPIRPDHKRKIPTTREPLRGSDAPGTTAAIHHIMARAEPRRIKHGRKSTWVKEFLVRWEPETSTFGEILEQYRLGFNISSITSREETVSSHLLAPFASTKRLARTQRRAIGRPPLSTRCVVIYDPSPHGPNHIRSITGGAQALYFFLANEAFSLPSIGTPAVTDARPTPIKRSSSAQA